MNEIRCKKCNKLIAKHYPLKLKKLEYTVKMIKEQHTEEKECLEIKCSRCGDLNLIVFE